MPTKARKRPANGPTTKTPTRSIANDPMLTIDDVIQKTGLTRRQLARWREHRARLPFYPVTNDGQRTVLYRQSDVDRYLESVRVEVRP
jgi:predicted DNA-binding transcriptional regulator AlpA